MLIYAFFALIAGAVATWLMLDDTSLARTAIAVVAGLVAGCIAGIVAVKWFYGAWDVPLDALVGSAFGVIVAVAAEPCRAPRSGRHAGPVKLFGPCLSIFAERRRTT